MDLRTDLVIEQHDNYLQRYAVFAFALLITLIYFSLLVQWISLNMVDRELQDYTHYVMGLAARGDRSPKQARDLVLMRAEKLSLPLDESGIRFTGGGTGMRAIVQYEADLTFPLTERPVYRVTFAHELDYRPPRW